MHVKQKECLSTLSTPSVLRDLLHPHSSPFHLEPIVLASVAAIRRSAICSSGSVEELQPFFIVFRLDGVQNLVVDPRCQSALVPPQYVSQLASSEDASRTQQSPG